VPNRQAIETTLGKLFDAERTVRKLHDDLAGLPADQLLEVLIEAVEAAKREQDEDEATLRLVRISSLLGEHEGPRAVDALIDVLTADHLEAYERFKEVAQGIERALKRLPVGSPALPELPYIIAEVPEPGVSKLLGLFLKHQDPDAVAAAIEALVEIGDPASASLIQPLVGDKRTVELDEEGADTTSEVTLGELAEEALELLSPYPDDEGDDGVRS
jgi:HEAT repeat protein